MKIHWHALLASQRRWLKTGWLVTAVIVAVYGGLIRPSQAFRGVAMERTIEDSLK